MKLQTETSIYKPDAVKNALKNKVIHASSEPSGTFSVGDTWFDSAHGYKMYVWDGSDWSPEELDSDAIKAGAIKASHIDAGAVTADKIAANSISTNKLMVGDMSNLATVNEWDEGSMVSSPSSIATDTVIINSTTGLRGIVKKEATQSGLALSQHRMPNIFTAGDEVYYSLRMRALTTGRNVVLRVSAYNEAGTKLGDNTKQIAITTTMTLYTGTITLADGADWTWASAAAYTIYITDNQVNGAYEQMRVIQAVVKKKSTGDMIIDGTITADKLSADAVNGKTITGTTIRTPSDYGNEMMFINDPDPGSTYFSEPFPASNLTRYMQIVQSGVESIDQTNYVRAQLSPTVLKVYKYSESGTNLVRQLEGWYLKGMAFSPRMYTQEGEVATIAPNRQDSVIDQDVSYITNWSDINISEWSTLGGCYYYKIGTRVHLHIAVTGLTADTNTVITTMPTGYRPYDYVVAAGRANTGSQFASMWVSSSGVVTVRSTGTNAAVDIEYDAFN